jgi:hypothetical protein
MPGHNHGHAAADGPLVFDPTIHGQVTALLGGDRTRSLLLMLRSLVMMLAGLGYASLLSPAGLASIHRLKSEAGLMGFVRLSEACAAFDEPGQGTSPHGRGIAELRSAIAATLLVTGELMGSVED